MSVPFAVANLGAELSGPPVSVTRERSIAFAESINDRNPDHLAGRSVPPMFVVAPIYPVLYPAVDLVTPPEFREQVVHGAHEIAFLRPLAIGAVVRAFARPVGLHAKRSGTAVTVQITISDDDGPCCEQYATAHVRGLVIEADVGREAPAQAVRDSVDREGSGPGVVSVVDPDQTHRYAAAAGDPMLLHLDDAVARSLGFPGIIAQGLCTMSMAGVAAITACCGGDPAALRGLAVRLAAPVFPGDRLRTHFQPSCADGWAFAFDTVNAEGVQVIRGGLVATVRPRGEWSGSQ